MPAQAGLQKTRKPSFFGEKPFQPLQLLNMLKKLKLLIMIKINQNALS